MLSKKGTWNEWNWQERDFPGHHNPEAKIIFEKNPNNGGLFRIVELNFERSELRVRSSRPQETHDLKYSINTERNELELKSVRFIDELDRLKEQLKSRSLSLPDYEKAVEKELERRSNQALQTTSASARRLS